jgi:hypothetical protein
MSVHEIFRYSQNRHDTLKRLIFRSWSTTWFAVMRHVDVREFFAVVTRNCLLIICMYKVKLYLSLVNQVPNHEDVWGSTGIALWFLTVALVLGEWPASRPCRFTPKETDPGTHWIGDWVVVRAGPDVLEKKTRTPISGSYCPYRSLCANWAVPAPLHTHTHTHTNMLYRRIIVMNQNYSHKVVKRCWISGSKCFETRGIYWLCLVLASCWFLVWLIFRPWRWRRYVTLKRPLTFKDYTTLYPRRQKSSS